MDGILERARGILAAEGRTESTGAAKGRTPLMAAMRATAAAGGLAVLLANAACTAAPPGAPGAALNNTLGTLGGIGVGAFAGSQFGHGPGKVATTLVGALLGGLAGNALTNPAPAPASNGYYGGYGVATGVPAAPGFGGAWPAYGGGAFQGPGPGYGQSGIAADAQFMQRAEQAAYASRIGAAQRWENPMTGNSGTITAVRDGMTGDGRRCREFEATLRINGTYRHGHVVACQNPGGGWQILSAAEAPHDHLFAAAAGVPAAGARFG